MNQKQQTTTNLDRRSWHVRWMIKRDMPEVVETERLSDGMGWEEQDFLFQIGQRLTIGHVAETQTEDGHRVCGHMVYELCKRRLEVHNLAVHPRWRNTGAGSAIITKLIGKLSSHRRTYIAINVPERLLETQLFLRNRGFEAIRVLRGHYGDEDAFRMVYRLTKTDKSP